MRNLFTSNFKIFLVVLLLVLLTETAIWRIGPSIKEYSSDRGVFWNDSQLVRKTQTADILILGDSSARGSFDTDILEDLSGLVPLQLAATRTTSLAGSYLLVVEYLKTNPPPRYILMMNTYTSWHLSPSDGVVLYRLLNSFPLETLRMITLETGESKKVLIEGTLPYLLVPSLKERFSLQRILYLPLPEYFGLYKELGQDKSLKDSQLISMDSSRNFVEENTFKVSPWNLYFLKELVSICGTNEIDLLVCLPPVWRELRDEQYLLDCKDFLDSQVSLLTKDFYPVNPSQVTNSDNHLNEEASIIYTRMIVEKLEELE